MSEPADLASTAADSLRLPRMHQPTQGEHPMSAVDMHDVTARFTRLARIGWAVTKLANQGAVEFRLDQIEDAARALEWPDLAYAIDKGGDLIDGPTLLTDEPTGDAMRWTKETK